MIQLRHKRKGVKTMTKLRLEKVNGQWYLHNVTSGRLLTETTEETQTLLRTMALKSGTRFILEVV